jgi:cardiolipin synthase
LELHSVAIRSMQMPVAAALAASHAAPTVQSRALSRCLQLPVLGGNRVELLTHGRPAAGAVFDALETARDHINLDTRLFDLETQGDALMQRLLQRCQAGVRVHLLVDGQASRGARSLLRLDQLRRGGVKLCATQPIARTGLWWGRVPEGDDAPRLILIDGRLAFVGGLGLRRVRGGTEGLARIEGPVVAELQWLFIDHWERMATRPMSSAQYFPPLAWIGQQRVGIAAAAGSGRSPFLRACVAAVAAAQTQVLLSSPYGLPPDALQRALLSAQARGIDAQLLWSSHGMDWVVRALARARTRRLQRAGVLVHEMAHRPLRARSSVIDGVWSSVGPSWCEHVERGGSGMNMIVLDAEFGARVLAAFRDEAARSRAGARAERRPGGRWQRIQLELSRHPELGP